MDLDLIGLQQFELLDFGLDGIRKYLFYKIDMKNARYFCSFDHQLQVIESIKASKSYVCLS